MKPLFGALLLTLAVSALPALAANSAFLKFGTGPDVPVVEGESTTVGFEKQIDVNSWKWSVANAGGRAKFGDFEWTQFVDKSVVPMFLGVANNTLFPSVALSVTKSIGGSRPQTFFQMTFSDIYLTSLSIAGSGDVPTVSGSLNYGGLKMLYRPQRKDGTLGDPVSGSFTISPSGVLTIAGSPEVIQGLFLSGGNVSLQSFAVTPVPEPQTWAMLLAGLMLLTVYATKMQLRGAVTTMRQTLARRS